MFQFQKRFLDIFQTGSYLDYPKVDHRQRCIMINVVHILNGFGIGGMEKGIAMLINHGSERFVHTLICLTQSGDSQKLLTKKIPIYEMYKPPGNSFRFICKLGRLLKCLQPDVVHCRNWGGTDGIIAARLAGIGGVIQGEHGWDVGDQDGLNKKRILIRRLLSLFVRQYSCVSTHMHTWLDKDVHIKKNISQIYNGIDTQLFRPTAGDDYLRQSLGIRKTDVVIGTVSRLDLIKNHALLIRAFKKINAQHPNGRLYIVGDGPEMNRLKTMANDNISLLGLRRDIPDILPLIDIYALTSINEGISNTILEAMACGKPVVATNVGGNPELVQNGFNGFLIGKDDEVGLCNALTTYIQDSGLRSLHGRNARSFVIEKFSIDRMVVNYETMYAKVAGLSIPHRA